MPEVIVGGSRLRYSIAGRRDRPALLFSNALGTSSSFWDLQVPAFVGEFLVVRYDVRGHGDSGAPAGEYTIDQLGLDVLAILDAEDIHRTHMCGLSLGGLTAIWLALEAASRVGKIVLANTGARIASDRFWQERIDLVRTRGLGPVAEGAPPRWFTEAFCREHPSIVASCRQMVLDCSPSGYAACAAALRDADLRPRLEEIAASTLVITGRCDPVTPPSDGAALCAGIRGARGVELNAAHFSNIERAAEFTDVVLKFLEEDQAASPRARKAGNS